jgi:chemosensory pili system protein ChpC
MGKRNRNRSNERSQPGKAAAARPGAAAGAASGPDRASRQAGDAAGATAGAADPRAQDSEILDSGAAEAATSAGNPRPGVERLATAGAGLAGEDAARRDDIRGVLIQVAGGRLLLPNATIAEVLSFADPEPIAGAPEWLLGRIRWRGWQLPLVAFSRLAGIAAEQGGLGSKVLVVKAFGGNPKLPYFALLTQGFPRLVTVSRQALVAVDHGAEALPEPVLAEVMLNEDQALLPDIDRIEALLGEALAQAA